MIIGRITSQQFRNLNWAAVWDVSRAHNCDVVHESGGEELSRSWEIHFSLWSEWWPGTMKCLVQLDWMAGNLIESFLAMIMIFACCTDWRLLLALKKWRRIHSIDSITKQSTVGDTSTGKCQPKRKTRSCVLIPIPVPHSTYLCLSVYVCQILRKKWGKVWSDYERRRWRTSDDKWIGSRVDSLVC